MNRVAMPLLFRSIAVVGIALVILCNLCDGASGQTSISPSLSPVISPGLSAENSPTDGLDEQFSSLSGGFTANSVHTDVSDPTHSQLLGSALSPAPNSVVSAYDSAYPDTGVLSNAQLVVGQHDFAYGGKRSQLFAPSAGSSIARSSRLDVLGAFGGGSMQSAFALNSSSRAAFSGQTARGPAAGASFSGEGVAAPRIETGVGIQQTLTAASLADTSDTRGSYLATDPVLTGSTNGYEADLQLNGDMSQPSMQVGQTFADTNLDKPIYQYEDGQTPLMSLPLHAGVVLNGNRTAEFLPSPTGFPDSTKGLAGLPTEASNAISSIRGASSLNTSATSPFAPISEGNVYGLKLSFAPSLHGQSQTTALRGGTSMSLDVFKRAQQRAERQRVGKGMSITDSTTIYRDAMRDAREKQRGRTPPKSLDEIDSRNRQATSGQNDASPVPMHMQTPR